MNKQLYVAMAACLGAATLLNAQGANAVKKSNITVYSLKEKSSKVIFTADQLIEAPNWSPDGKELLVNTKGDLYKLPVESAKPELQKIDLGSITRCNNDKGFSPDGKSIAF